MHVVLDDWNLDDSTLALCKNYIEQPDYLGNVDVTPERIGSERACANALEAMTEEERGSALAIYDGYLQV